MIIDGIRLTKRDFNLRGKYYKKAISLLPDPLF